MTPNIAAIIRQHVSLEVRCLDRLYLHAYMPKLQTSGGLCYFLRDHLGYPIPSPALFKPMHDRFTDGGQAVCDNARHSGGEMRAGQDRDAIANAHRRASPNATGVVLLGLAQEKQRSFKAQKRRGPQGGVTFDFSRQWVAADADHFYVHDCEWGPAFRQDRHRICRIPIKICLNGHEWVKQQLRRHRIRFESLDNGFLACADPAACKTTCDALGPRDVQSVLRSLGATAALAD